MKHIILGVLLSGIALTSCKKKEVIYGATPSASKFKIGTETTASNKTVTLYADEANLYTGSNNLYVKLEDAAGAPINSAMVMYMPMMDMTTMSHSSPAESPTYNDSLKMYEGLAVFTMPSTLGTWTLEVTVDGETVVFEINVMNSDTKMVGTYTGTDGASYVISLVRPVNWEVGFNDVEIMIHRRASMMSFPADDGFDIVMTPEMVSMGHGSPDNVSPTSIGNGHYKGVVNYTMSGDWRLHFQLIKNGVEIHNDAYLDILF